VCFIGHTHRPFVSVLKAGLLVEERPEVIAIESACHYLINVGSVGQPRNHDPRCSYVIHDGDAQTVTFRKVDYPVSITQRRIREQNLPDRLAERLAVGV
jgi:diadenosine tetraphosphatase ApaH/serine/threonine PP2A family protein phosphatase